MIMFALRRHILLRFYRPWAKYWKLFNKKIGTHKAEYTNIVLRLSKLITQARNKGLDRLTTQVVSIKSPPIGRKWQANNSTFAQLLYALCHINIQIQKVLTMKAVPTFQKLLEHLKETTENNEKCQLRCWSCR